MSPAKRGKGTDKKKKKGKKNPPGATAPVTTTGWVGFVSTRMNVDETHPLSFQKLGRWIDLPTVFITTPAYQATVDAIADGEIIKGSQMPQVIRVTTEVMHVGLNEVYELNISDAYGNPIASGQGRFWCRGWSMQLGSPWEMVHILKRVIDFRAASFFTPDLD